jgi:molybdopterin biosynthesis enzyme MoaB
VAEPRGSAAPRSVTDPAAATVASTVLTTGGTGSVVKDWTWPNSAPPALLAAAQ